MGSSKRFVRKATLATAVSAAASFTSTILVIDLLDDVQVQADVVSGSPTGSIDVQVSSNHVQDFMGNVTTAGTWATVASLAITAGSPATSTLNLPTLSAPYLRVVYTRGSGSGTITVVASGKSI